jgi:hypothetical protein
MPDYNVSLPASRHVKMASGFGRDVNQNRVLLRLYAVQFGSLLQDVSGQNLGAVSK